MPGIVHLAGEFVLLARAHARPGKRVRSHSTATEPPCSLCLSEERSQSRVKCTLSGVRVYFLFCFVLTFQPTFFFSDHVSHPMQSVFLPPLPEVCECLASAVFIVCVRRTARCPVRIFQLLFHPHGPPTTPFRSLHQCPTATPTLTCSRKENHRVCVCVCVRACVCVCVNHHLCV